jgi:hypothetical protein
VKISPLYTVALAVIHSVEWEHRNNIAYHLALCKRFARVHEHSNVHQLLNGLGSSSCSPAVNHPFALVMVTQRVSLTAIAGTSGAAPKGQRRSHTISFLHHCQSGTVMFKDCHPVFQYSSYHRHGKPQTFSMCTRAENQWSRGSTLVLSSWNVCVLDDFSST